MKAILLIDMPRTCSNCPCYVDDYFVCAAAHKKMDMDTPDEGKPSWCPLKQLPEKQPFVPMQDERNTTQVFAAGFETGWNACIDEITGGKK